MRFLAPLIALVVAAAAATAAEPSSNPPREPASRAPGQRTAVEGAPRLRLKKERLAETIAAIKNDRLAVEKRVAAVAVAAMTRDTRTLGALATVARRPDNADVRVACIWAMGEIGDPIAIPTLLDLQAAATGPRPSFRYDKKVQFPGTGKELSLPDLIETEIGDLGVKVLSVYLRALEAAREYRSQSDKLTNRQRAALAVIVCVGDRDQRAIDALADVLRAPTTVYPSDFRSTAALGLARMLVEREKEFRKVRTRDKVADRITELLVEHILTLPPSRTREYIASALHLARATHAVTLLVRNFANDSPEPVRLRTIEVLGMLRSRDSVPALAWALDKEANPELRWRAAYGLGLSGDRTLAFEPLKKALKDKSPRVRRAAMAALGRLGGTESVPLIAPGAKSEDPVVRAEAVRALGMTRDKTALPALLAAAKDQHPAVRATAVAALGAIPSVRSMRAITAAARDEHRSVRYAALKVLVSLHGPAVYKALFELLPDPDRKIRSEAGNALRIGRAHHVAAFQRALIHVLTDPTSPASADACDFAEFPGDRAVIDALRKAATDKRPSVRASAIRMLRELKAQ
jgi:HEAT repeat protein